MNETVENLILAQLRELRGDMARLREDLDTLSMKIDGVAALVSTMTSFMQNHEFRIDALERGLEHGEDA